jgi:dihydrofolate reductase
MTGRILIDIFSTLDGVGQGPGGLQEDTSGGFRYGGWQGPVTDDVVGREIMAGIDTLDALLLGRKTYDIWADYWPTYGEGDANPIATKFNAVPKYIASRGTPELAWEGSVQLGPDVRAEVAALRERHREIHVIGSLDFAQTLLGAQLFDVLNLWVFPVVLGDGKRVFPPGVDPARLRLLEPPVVAGTGAVLLRYGPDGQPRFGDIDPRD